MIIKNDDDQVVTRGMLKSILREELTEILTEAFAAQEKRILTKVEAIIDIKIKESETRTAELIADLMERIDERFNRLEKHYTKRLNNHAVQIDKLQAKLA